MSIRLPNAFIIGAQKSATTSLANLLGAHPKISLGKTKEQNVFGCHAESERLGIYQDWQNPAADIRIDASTHYLSSAGSLQRISELCRPNPRIIVALREPVSRAISAYFHQQGSEADMRSAPDVFGQILEGGGNLSFQDAIGIEQERLISSVISGQVKVNPFLWRFHDPLWGFRYLDNSNYCKYVERVFSIFDRKNVKVLFVDELRVDRDGIINRLCTFLGADPNLVPPIDEIPDLNVRMIAHSRAPIGLVRKLRRSIPSKMLNAIPNKYKSAYRNVLYKRPDPIEKEIEEGLRLIFAPELRELKQIIGRSLPDAW